MPVLNAGDPFPTLSISASDGHTLQLPDALAGKFGVILFYRGAWCPYCIRDRSPVGQGLLVGRP